MAQDIRLKISNLPWREIHIGNYLPSNEVISLAEIGDLCRRKFDPKVSEVNPQPVSPFFLLLQQVLRK